MEDICSRTISLRSVLIFFAIQQVMVDYTYIRENDFSPKIENTQGTRTHLFLVIDA